MPVKSAEVGHQQMRKIPKTAFRLRSPVRGTTVKQLMAPKPAGIPSGETSEKRETDWADSICNGAIKDARKTCYSGSGKVAPRRGDQSRRYFANAP